MEGLESFHAYLKSLSHHAGILAEAAVFLSKSFEVEADRLTREDGVHRLKEIQATVVKELELSRQQESAASYEYSKVNLPFSLAGLAAKIIVTATTKNRRTLNLVSQVCDTSTAKKLPYGRVMVCVGLKGLPDDVRVVSISELARESNRPESETIQKLQKGGCLLFSPERFSSLIDKLVIDIREGRLHLPIPIEKLSERVASGYQRLEAKQSKWALYSSPQ